jgi:hypothetical protein
MGWAIIIIWVAAAAAAASWIGWKVKGRPLTGFLLGIFLGWIGVLVTALLPLTAEKRVQRRLRDEAVALEVQRRKQGRQPWSTDAWSDGTPPERSASR